MRLASDIPVAASSISPVSIAPAGNAQSGWIDMKEANLLSTLAMTGVGVTDVTVSFEQAQDAAGAGAKALDGQFEDVNIVAASAETYIEGEVTELDVNGGFRFVRVTITNGGAAAALVSAAIFAVRK